MWIAGAPGGQVHVPYYCTCTRCHGISANNQICKSVRLVALTLNISWTFYAVFSKFFQAIVEHVKTNLSTATFDPLLHLSHPRHQNKLSYYRMIVY
jgi:hypothetical protein